jgi:uncharacterized membrane protein
MATLNKVNFPVARLCIMAAIIKCQDYRSRNSNGFQMLFSALVPVLVPVIS